MQKGREIEKMQNKYKKEKEKRKTKNEQNREGKEEEKKRRKKMKEGCWPAFCTDGLDDGVSERLPPLVLVRVCFGPSHRQHCVEQQHLVLALEGVYHTHIKN